jgi:hypothetical protein
MLVFVDSDAWRDSLGMLLATAWMTPTTRSGAKRGAGNLAKISKGSSSHDTSTERAKKYYNDFDTKKNKTRDDLYPMNKFPYHLDYKSLDLRKEPHLYRPGLGEQGVLMVEPYKSEMVPLWRFKDPLTATESSRALQGCFDKYISQSDFVGADMARKFIQVSVWGDVVRLRLCSIKRRVRSLMHLSHQMGFTRSRRYANHKGGRKYSYKDGKKGKELPRVDVEDKVKAESAEIFKGVLEIVKVDERYQVLRQEFEKKWKDVPISSKASTINKKDGDDGPEG